MVRPGLLLAALTLTACTSDPRVYAPAAPSPAGTLALSIADAPPRLTALRRVTLTIERIEVEEA